ncbi:MAG: PorV/PorQ family protein [Bacteroidales bacterium]|nr:PorV/PorQ family protein [Bacteroidales bacterium]MDZ4203886.1 PorV/PorQ family protein [Bacteroidales bacterium]
MKSLHKYLITGILVSMFLFPVNDLFAGNKDRSGQAGASELLINPWARSSGWGGANTSRIRGLEAMYGNVAGIAFTKSTELIFSNTDWLKGSEIGVSSFGLTQRIGETGVFGLSIMSMKFGDIPITTVDLPAGGIGTFAPSYMNLGLSYAKAFSNSIYGGFTLKIISESIADVSAQGIAIDAGIQYVTGEMENITFGITLKNIGPTMQFSGDGLSIRSFLPGQESQFTVEQRSADFELPSQLIIGAAYDFLISENHTITLAGNFTSNSFLKDQFSGGLEYALRNYLMVRAGYTYEEGITKKGDRTTAYTGPSAGITVQVPLNKEKGSVFGVDYSYRDTDPWAGTHSISARLTF